MDDGNRTLRAAFFKDYEITDDTVERNLSTHEIVQQIEVRRTSRGGELHSGKRAILALVFPNSSQPPICIEVQDKFVIGRLQSSDGSTPDLDLNRYGAYLQGVSRQHIAFLKQDDILQIMDLDSTNGTYLNGEKLMPQQARILRDGDQLCLGLLPVLVLFMPSDYAPDINISYESPTKWVVRVS